MDQSPRRGRRTSSVSRPRGRRSSSTFRLAIDYLDPEPQNSDEMFDGPAIGSVPSAYSNFHRVHRIRSHSRSSSVGSSNFMPPSPALLRSPDVSSPADALLIGSPPEKPFLHRASIDSSFRFFTAEEIEEAQGSSTIIDEPDPYFSDYDDYGSDTMPSRRHHPHRRERLLSAGSSAPLMASDARSASFQSTDNVDGFSDGSHTSAAAYSKFYPDFPCRATRQRFYLAEEDLVIGIAAFRTSRLRHLLYLLLCWCTLGVAYLLFRWFPRWRIAMRGTPTSLAEAEWVVIETELGELTIADVTRNWYNSMFSSVFASTLAERDPYVEGDGRPGNSEGGASGGTSAGSAGLAGSPAGSSVNSASTPESSVPATPGEPFDTLLPVLISFEYRHFRFFFSPPDGLFRTNLDWTDPAWTRRPAIRAGLSETLHKDRTTVFGQNVIDIQPKPIVQLLFDELLHPFYVFQLFSIVLWSLDEYYYYAGCIFVISVVSVGNTLVETRQTLARLRELARHVCEVRIWRNGFWKVAPSAELVPGDVFELSDPALTVLPCDCVLIAGDCILNESMLTGESVPVSKVPAAQDELELLVAESSGPDVPPALARCFLFAGTRLIRVRKLHDEPAMAMVVRTGFATTKGSLIRSMLFPKPMGFKFYRDSFKYIAAMAGVAAVGFVVSTVNFIRMGLPTSVIVFRALDIVTIVVPPALPATLTIGTNFALSRLRKKQVFCISPNRVNVGGKLDVLCFDKTGTLTEDGLDVLGVHTVRCSGNQGKNSKDATDGPASSESRLEFSPLIRSATDLYPGKELPTELASSACSAASGNSGAAMIAAMATCHSLRIVDAELVGDPLDFKMFEFSGWQYAEDGGNGSGSSITPPLAWPGIDTSEMDAASAANHLGVLRSFDFVPALRRMSVVVKPKSSSAAAVFVKGAPEVMRDICKPESLPADFSALLHRYTHAGFRVIACATKSLSSASWLSIQKLPREEIESGLEFAGLIVFENKLKPSSAPVLAELHRAHIRTIMCTGDNVFTAVSVARECGLVGAATRVYVPRILSGATPFGTQIQWENVQDVSDTLDAETLTPRRPAGGAGADNSSSARETSSFPGSSAARAEPDFTLAVTGDVFRSLVTEAADSTLSLVLLRSSVYARMSPDEKHELVERLQALDYTVGFCGDGANDCGALKAADVGISLSEAEASVAAPFTSRVFDISCVLHVMQEGRAALVTSFSCFKYMSLYSAIQFASVSILYSRGSNLGDLQFLWIDLFLILPLAAVMAWARPFPQLAVKRPTANLVSPKVLLPLLLQIGVLVLFQVSVWRLVAQQPWYERPIPGGDDEVASSDNSALFVFGNFQYIFIAVVLSVGPPYREPVAQNRPFVATVVATTVACVGIMALSPDSGLGSLLDLSYLSWDFDVMVLLLAAVNFAVCWWGEKRVFPAVAAAVKKMVYYVLYGTSSRPSKKMFKRVLQLSGEKV